MPQSARRPEGGGVKRYLGNVKWTSWKRGIPLCWRGDLDVRLGAMTSFWSHITHLRRTTRGSWSRWCQRHDLVGDGDCDDEDEDDGCDHQDNHDHQDDATWPKTELDERFAHRLHLVQVLMKIIDVSGYVMQSIFKYLEIIFLAECCTFLYTLCKILRPTFLSSSQGEGCIFVWISRPCKSRFFNI